MKFQTSLGPLQEAISRPARSKSFAKRWRETHVADFISERFKLDRKSRVLEVGCRGGENVLNLSRRTGAQVVGVDPDNRLVKRAIETRDKGGPEPRVHFYAEPPESLPFEGETFDLIFCDRILNSVESASELINGLVEMTKPDGSIVLMDLYQRFDYVSCASALKAWLGDACQTTALFDTISFVDEAGLALTHFELLDDRLVEQIESMVWESLTKAEDSTDASWRNPISWRTGWALLEAIDRREIGYAAVVFRKGS